MFNFTNENWPKDHYVDPQSDSVNIAAGQTLTPNFVFKHYAAFVTGKCTIAGVGLPGVEISGITIDLLSGTLNLYQTVSLADGNYKLGVLPGTLNMLSAEKEGFDLTSPVGGMYMNVTVANGQTFTGKDFTFEPTGSITSISGTITFSNGSAAPNVYVAAENFFEESPEGFLITYSDGNGNYSFPNVLIGDYQVGVYLNGYSSDPPMRYFYVYQGSEVSEQDFVLSPGTGVAAKHRSFKPMRISLFQNYPNPFNPSTSIRFDLSQTSQIEINIFNAAGQKIRSLVNGNYNAGQHEIEWDGRNDAGLKVTSGLYFYQLMSDNYTKVMKMIMAK